MRVHAERTMKEGERGLKRQAADGCGGAWGACRKRNDVGKT